MLGLSRRVRVFAYRAPTDMRKSFNTLAALVLEMGQDVVTGDAFLFVGRGRRKAKVLCFGEPQLDFGALCEIRRSYLRAVPAPVARPNTSRGRDPGNIRLGVPAFRLRAE